MSENGTCTHEHAEKPSAGFVHLHVHSEYSVLDGASKIGDLIHKAKENNMKALALTDHGAMFGAIEFYEKARAAGIKPIIGCELYLSKDSRFERKGRGANAYHQLMLCETTEGYHNLCRLSSIGYIEGYYYRPRIDFESLAKYKNGLIATSSCLAGEIPQFLMDDKIDEARAALGRYVEVLGKDHFIIELMDHGMEEQIKINPLLRQLAADHGLLVIASNDSHYTNKEDAEAHDVLLAIQTSAMLSQTDRLRFSGDEYYLCTAEEMRAKFPDLPEALTNTERIADRCNVEIPLGKHLIPEYKTPQGVNKRDYLTALVMKGVKERYGATPPQSHVERAEYEISVIDKMGFVDYFLVVWDLINYARENNIPVGPGRGSGAGSLVAYCLHITNIDPLRYNLLFERFLNPERVSMPDFDIDFCYERRGEMIKYSIEKYGKDNVSQIITFGRMLAKAVIRDVGRVMGLPYDDVDKIAKLVPEELKITLKSAAEKEPKLQEILKQDEQIRKLWEYSVKLEGTIRNCGTHAAGVIICDQPLTDHVPLFKAPQSDFPATQYEMARAEQVGLLKMDFLGLRTLTVVHKAVELIARNRGVTIDIDNIEPNDAKAYEVLRSGRTTGIFQLESSGMRELAKRIGLESLEEICALVALYRPGPMELKDDYIANKFDAKRIKYEHPILEPILGETYGIALYQEQVMQIAQAVAGFTLGEADILRRAMGKKKADLLAKQRAKFLAGAATKGIEAKTANELFDKIEKFAGYGFNKSHSMAYAFVAYQTAFLKANYPAEFMAALLTSESGNLDKVAVYVEECRQMGIDVLPPDVNHSHLVFTADGNSIRFGMGAVKNVGEMPVHAIVSEREANGPYADIYDFCSRADMKSINRRVIESLNKAGAFASTGWARSQVEEALDMALSEGQVRARERASGQESLFDLLGDADSAGGGPIAQKPDVPEWPESEILALEKEMLGLYVSSHPLAKHARTLRAFTNASIHELDASQEGRQIILGGMLGNVKRHALQKGKNKGRMMGFITLDTLEGPCELTVFSDTYEKREALLTPERIVMAQTKVSYRNGELSLIADDLVAIEDCESALATALHIRLNPGNAGPAQLNELAELLGEKTGECDVYLHCETAGGREVVVHASESCRIAYGDDLRPSVEALVGPESVWYSGPVALPSHRHV